MTRDEAIEIFGGKSCHGEMHGSECARWVDSFVALGMLKLEEPKSASRRFTELYVRLGCATEVSSECFLAHLKNSGIKLTER